MSAVNSILEIIAEALKIADGYIDDPRRRLQARLKRKEYIRIQAMELIKKGVPGEEADSMALALLDFVSKL